MTAAVRHPDLLGRRRWLIRGQVQGVGFRPYVYRLAKKHQLSGFVRNGPQGVIIEAQGADDALDLFARALHEERPPLAVIESVNIESLSLDLGEHKFEIAPSDDQPRKADAQVAIDTAVCPDCLREMLEGRDRRAGYALINCTNCGPRFSIIRNVPYDRPNTTMAKFTMCRACEREYRDAGDRRFHAQPIACHDCGPKLALVNPAGRRIKGDPIANAANLLLKGNILAIKGLGGFHLAVRADHAEGVAELRRRKHRDAKPFAVMVRDLDAARWLVKLSPTAKALLSSPRCPIVLATRCVDLPGVAPDSHRLGVMLPYTPIQHLLFAADPRLQMLVMTSGNVSDEPLVISNSEAVERLGGLCDAMLWHDRPIERPVDDSVYLDMPGDDALLPIRRARGDVPGAIGLPIEQDTAGLCVGGELKNTIAVVRRREAILSQHLGDLKHPLALENFARTIDDMLRLFEVKPRWIAHDLHPAYLSTAHARKLAARWNVPLIAVQHHHAHAAALLAEYDMTGPILALVADGVGHGDDDTSWGGELMLCDLHGYQRVAHLRPLLLAGGDAAAFDTRRCAMALLQQALGEKFDQHPMAAQLYPDENERRMLCEMIRRQVNCATSSAMGRVFDGVAAMTGVCTQNAYEAQAPMMLEAAAAGCVVQSQSRPFSFSAVTCKGQIDLSLLIRELLAQPRPADEQAALFHHRLADILAATIIQASKDSGIQTVGLTGGVFCNQLLTQLLTQRLQSEGLNVLRHRRVPATDGGLALGQAAVAAARINEQRS
ncbi:MAG: carbamoyltransferase HypF [Phycisphaeraceae bacterium]|nr:carbamoyltransferase HypF [Phycisphaeraceae bacterium]